MAIKTYSDALAYIYAYTNFDPANFDPSGGLARLRNLLAEVGNPQQKFPSLLIAGTKGKGSTAAMCESMLGQAGYKTGLYTSPHLHSFRERIRLAGELVSEATVVALTRRLQPFFEAAPGLSAFELITALAFVAFAEAEIEVAVLEVGLGGRLDATNVVEPVVAVITSISYDHTQILGETLTLIAGEKAGIIRPGAAVISAPQVAEAMQTIAAVCQAQQAQLTVVEREWPWQLEASDLSGQTFTVAGECYRLPLLGEHQVANAVTALAAVATFAEKTGFVVPMAARVAGLAQVRWPGRMEILQERPYLIIDSAMNGDSAEKLAQTLAAYFPAQKIYFIFGVSSDHPFEDMLTALLPLAQQIWLVSSGHPRAATPENLQAVVTEMGYPSRTASTVTQALEVALADAGPAEVICVTGSLFLAAPARLAWLRRHNLPLPPVDPLVLS